MSEGGIEIELEDISIEKESKSQLSFPEKKSLFQKVKKFERKNRGLFWVVIAGGYGVIATVAFIILLVLITVGIMYWNF
jgi:hypothetical protein